MIDHRTTTPRSKGRTEAARPFVHSARWIVLLTILIEVQTPRFGGSSRLNLAIVAALLLVLLAKRSQAVARNTGLLFAWPLAPLLLYVLWCLGSALWAYSATEALLQAGFLLLALLVAISYAEVPRAVFAQETVRVIVWLCLLSWAMAVALPNIAVLPDVTWRLNGPMQHSQRLALIAGAAAILLVALLVTRRRVFASRPLDVLALSLLFATILATQTRANTAFVVATLAAVVYAYVKPWQKVMLLASFISLIISIVWNFERILAAIDREGSNTMTLTGRTRTWEAALEMIPDQLFQGYGFGSFYSPLTAYFFSSGYISPHAHNTWINSAFETGIIGMGLLSLFIVGALLGPRRPRAVNLFAWPIVLLGTLAGLTGIVYGGKLSSLWLLSVILVSQAVHSRTILPAVRGPSKRGLPTARS